MGAEIARRRGQQAIMMASLAVALVNQFWI